MKFLLNCAQLLILQYIICVLLSCRYSSDLSSDSIDPYLLSNHSVKNLAYSLRYGSASLFLLFELKSSPSSTSTTLKVSSSSDYILYSFLMGSR